LGAVERGASLPVVFHSWSLSLGSGVWSSVGRGSGSLGAVAEQGGPHGFPWPLLGQVERDASGGRCDPGWDCGDEFPAIVAAARVRLKDITARNSQAAFAVNTPEGRLVDTNGSVSAVRGKIALVAPAVTTSDVNLTGSLPGFKAVARTVVLSEFSKSVLFLASDESS
jgi:hypothetical protein